jgi:hypothetical protein
MHPGEAGRQALRPSVSIGPSHARKARDASGHTAKQYSNGNVRLIRDFASLIPSVGGRRQARNVLLIFAS